MALLEIRWSNWVAASGHQHGGGSNAAMNCIGGTPETYFTILLHSRCLVLKATPKSQLNVQQVRLDVRPQMKAIPCLFSNEHLPQGRPMKQPFSRQVSCLPLYQKVQCLEDPDKSVQHPIHSIA